MQLNKSVLVFFSEQSDHTSIKERIAPQFDLAEAIRRQTEQQALSEFAVPLKPLLGFEGVIRNGFQRGISSVLKITWNWWTAPAELAGTTSVGPLIKCLADSEAVKP